MEKKKIEIGFEILHYLSVDETIECVKSIKKYCKNHSYYIAIVDNASSNNSYEDLWEKYVSDNHVTVIKSDKNLGFAKGNNLGYMWLKNHFDCDFIVMSNNDVELLDYGFIEKVYSYYDQYRFAVLGPNIQNHYESSGKCNPMRLEPETLKEIKRSRRKIVFQYWLVYLRLYNVLHYIKEKTIGLNKNKASKYKYDYGSVNTNAQLHGCFLVFSKEYINRRDGLNPNTFLYLEEDILYFEMLMDGLLTISVPDIKVLHKERVATKKLQSNNRSRELFVLENKTKSINVLLEVAQRYWKKEREKCKSTV